MWKREGDREWKTGNIDDITQVVVKWNQKLDDELVREESKSGAGFSEPVKPVWGARTVFWHVVAFHELLNDSRVNGRAIHCAHPERP